MQVSHPVRAAWLIIEATLAGLVVGAVEVVRALAAMPQPPGAAGILQTAVLVIGLTSLGAAAVGPILVAPVLALARTKWMRAWGALLAEPGAPRATAVARAILVVAGLMLFALGAFLLTRWVHESFVAAGAMALLESAALAALAAVLLAACVTADERVTHRVAALPAVQRFTVGWRGRGLLLAMLVLVTVLGGAFLRRAAPDADFSPYVTSLGFVMLLAVARLAALGARLARAGAVAAALALALVVTSLVGVGRWEAPRQTVIGYGVASARTLQALWLLGDRDGDGFSGWFGAGDCDDGDPRVYPGAPEIPDNGVDENCDGEDLSASQLAARTSAHPTSYPDAPRYNVILLSIDSVRADHLGAYGYERPTSPVLDRIAAEGTRFDWALTTSPTTRRAIPSMMTARYASALHWQDANVRLAPKRQVILGESFKAAGYDTFAIMCCTVLFDKAHGVVEGIDAVDASADKIGRKAGYNSDAVADRVIDLLDTRAAAAAPFFLWIHLIDPHSPYRRPPGAPDFGDRDLDRYDGEIAFVDAQIGRVRAKLEATGLWDRTVIAIVSDHGQEFHEHGNRFHGRSLYNEVVRIPFLVRYPGAPHHVVSTPVSLLDVGPTLLDLVGLDRPAGQNGLSLARTVRDRAPAPDRVILSELIPDYRIDRNLRAAFYDTWKLIWDLEADTYELYSLSQDAQDRFDRRAADPTTFRLMQRRLHEAAERELSPLPSEQEPPTAPSAADAPPP